MAEYLKDDALDFLREAEDDLRNGRYNLAMFHLEQALQLALKYKLFQLNEAVALSLLR
ncbi:HEPN domain-containing protein [Caldivirga sp. UBA161]|uniref:HEPN domain-containing protein n=1 Tax=Caldivirga sp. UBA161 TaxID=1915569 RepID=UPI0025B9FB2A|nr:HEPN domain-containing protein [Caldivirga sp. UBA161]